MIRGIVATATLMMRCHFLARTNPVALQIAHRAITDTNRLKTAAIAIVTIDMVMAMEQAAHPERTGHIIEHRKATGMGLRRFVRHQNIGLLLT